MPANTPLLVAIAEILKHTPTYVWLILAALVAVGSRQLRDHVVTRTRLAMAPIALGVYSLWSATAAFGLRPEVIAAWLISIAISIGANQWLRWPREVRAVADGRFTVIGSPWPLVMMVGVFALRYVIAVSLAFHPDWARDPALGLTMALVYGAISGLFAARALRILRSAVPTGRLASASASAGA